MELNTGSSQVSPGGGYPAAPYSDAPVDHNASQGMTIMTTCLDRGRAYNPTTGEASYHAQCHGLYPTAPFGKASL